MTNFCSCSSGAVLNWAAVLKRFIPWIIQGSTGDTLLKPFSRWCEWSSGGQVLFRKKSSARIYSCVGKEEVYCSSCVHWTLHGAYLPAVSCWLHIHAINTYSPLLEYKPSLMGCKIRFRCICMRTALCAVLPCSSASAEEANWSKALSGGDHRVQLSLKIWVLVHCLGIWCGESLYSYLHRDVWNKWGNVAS